MLARTVAALVVCIYLHELYARYRARNLPPGIAGLWCLFETPKEKPWLKLLQFNRKYGARSHDHEVPSLMICPIGDIASGSLCGYNFIVIGCAKIAADLLDKRGINYADRPRSVMAGELAGWGKTMLLCNYTDQLRTQRKWIAHDLGSHAVVAKFHEMIEVETRRTLRSVLEDPDRLHVHVHKYVRDGSFLLCN
jgi:hypothetical protein